MGKFWEGFAGQIVAALLPLIIVGVAGLLLWQKLFGKKTAEKVVEDTLTAAKSIPGGLVSVAGSVLRGESEDGYISQEQARANDAASLAARRTL